VLELETYINGQRFAMGGIAGVATWPEYRRQGLVAKLLVHMLQDMRSNGQTLSFLHPFAHGFYRKFGWETYTDEKVYTLKTGQLPPRINYNGRIVRCQNGHEPVRELYSKYASEYNGTLVRTELWWKYRIAGRKSGQTAVYYDVHNEPVGYVFYNVKDRKMVVHELVALTSEARAALWSFIGQHDSMFTELTIKAPADDLLPFMLSDQRIKQEITPYTMGRIVDAEAFVAFYPFAAGAGEDRLLIDLKDEHASWNNGCFELVIQPSGRATLEPWTGTTENEEVLKLDIGAFSSALIGYLRPLQLWQLNRLAGKEDTIKRLQARIPEQTTYLPDFF
jgi:predicted acetyltransferase